VAGATAPEDIVAVQPRFQVATLSTAKDALPQFLLSASPEMSTPSAIAKFASAEQAWLSEQLTEAVMAYVDVMESHPNTAQAKAADSRVDYIFERLTPDAAAAIEAQLPSMEALTNPDAVASVGSFYFLRAIAIADSEPEQAARYFATVCDDGWRIFTEKLDDDFKIKILEAYLVSADAIGRGEEIRAKLSDHANEIPPSFTSWLIKTVVDRQEPPFTFVPSVEGRKSVKEFYLVQAGNASGPAVAESFYAKALEASWLLLNEQPSGLPVFSYAEDFLNAAEGIGETRRAEAVATIEERLESESLTIMRWITRYELAVHLTRAGASEEETIAGFGHFNTLVEEAASGVVDAAINDPRADEDTRGLLMCVLGHAYYGTNRIDEADACYQLVLEHFPPESHAGESASFSRVEVARRRNFGDTDSIVDTYEQFAASYPDSYYGPLAMIRAGEELTQAKRFESAESVYQRILDNYSTSSNAKSAEEHLSELAVLSAASEEQ
jgi:tetratricopeptide (TPR) repeat protein